MICQHCGATISDNDNFCIYCGMPQEGGTASPAQQTMRPIRLTLDQLLGDTFTLYGRHFGIMCMVGLILMGVQTIFNVCGVITEQAFLFLFLGLLASCYTWVVAMRQCLYTARGGAGFLPNLMVVSLMIYLKMIGLLFVTLCIAFGFCALLATPFAAIVFVGVFLLANSFLNALVAAGMTMSIAGVIVIYPMVRLWLPYCFLVDRNMGIIDSVKTTWRMMSGNFWALFVALFIVFAFCWFCWIIPCTIVLKVVFGLDTNTLPGILLINFGSIFLVPMIYLVSVLAYLQLTGEPHYLRRIEMTRHNSGIDPKH